MIGHGMSHTISVTETAPIMSKEHIAYGLLFKS